MASCMWNRRLTSNTIGAGFPASIRVTVAPSPPGGTIIIQRFEPIAATTNCDPSIWVTSWYI